MLLTSVLITALLYTVVSAAPSSVLLRDVSSLVFKQDAWTTARRSSSIPQLKCMNPGSYATVLWPSSIMCSNKGIDGHDIVWKCEAQLAPGLRLGKTEVSCEGYAYPNDPSILVGSCGLEYELTGKATAVDELPLLLVVCFVVVFCVCVCVMFNHSISSPHSYIPPARRRSPERPPPYTRPPPSPSPVYQPLLYTQPTVVYHIQTEHTATAPPQPKPTIAILPLKSASPDTSVSYATTKRREETVSPVKTEMSTSYATTKRR